MTDQQCAIKMTIDEANRISSVSEGKTKIRTFFWRQRPIERIWVQGYIQQQEPGTFVLSDLRESTSQDGYPQLDVFASHLKEAEAELADGDYVLVVGKLRGPKPIKSGSSLSGSMSSGQQRTTRHLGISAHKVIKLPGESLGWQQLWAQELAHLHSEVYPQTWLSQ